MTAFTRDEIKARYDQLVEGSLPSKDKKRFKDFERLVDDYTLQARVVDSSLPQLDKVTVFDLRHAQTANGKSVLETLTSNAHLAVNVNSALNQFGNYTGGISHVELVELLTDKGIHLNSDGNYEVAVDPTDAPFAEGIGGIPAHESYSALGLADFLRPSLAGRVSATVPDNVTEYVAEISSSVMGALGEGNSVAIPAPGKLYQSLLEVGVTVNESGSWYARRQLEISISPEETPIYNNTNPLDNFAQVLNATQVRDIALALIQATPDNGLGVQRLGDHLYNLAPPTVVEVVADDDATLSDLPIPEPVVPGEAAFFADEPIGAAATASEGSEPFFEDLGPEITNQDLYQRAVDHVREAIFQTTIRPSRFSRIEPLTTDSLASYLTSGQGAIVARDGVWYDKVSNTPISEDRALAYLSSKKGLEANKHDPASLDNLNLSAMVGRLGRAAKFAGKVATSPVWVPLVAVYHTGKAAVTHPRTTAGLLAGAAAVYLAHDIATSFDIVPQVDYGAELIAAGSDLEDVAAVYDSWAAENTQDMQGRLGDNYSMCTLNAGGTAESFITNLLGGTKLSSEQMATATGALKELPYSHNNDAGTGLELVFPGDYLCQR